MQAMNKAGLLALLWGVAMPALAATPINQTRPLTALGRVEIENLKGRVEVRAWDRPEVKITGSLGDGVEAFRVEGDDRVLRIEVRYPSRSNNAEPTTLIVQMPLQASLDIDTVSADIDVHGMASREMRLETVSGRVVAAGAPERAKLETVSGDLRLSLNSSDVEVDTVSGEVELRGRLRGTVALETVSGDMRIDSREEAVHDLSASSVSGDVYAKLGLRNGGRLKFENVSGDLQLELPKAVSARVAAESLSGELEIHGAQVVHEKYGPGSRVDTRYGDGLGEVRLETFSGDVTLRLY